MRDTVKGVFLGDFICPQRFLGAIVAVMILARVTARAMMGKSAAVHIHSVNVTKEKHPRLDMADTPG